MEICCSFFSSHLDPQVFPQLSTSSGTCLPLTGAARQHCFPLLSESRDGCSLGLDLDPVTSYVKKLTRFLPLANGFQHHKMGVSLINYVNFSLWHKGHYCVMHLESHCNEAHHILLQSMRGKRSTQNGNYS